MKAMAGMKLADEWRNGLARRLNAAAELVANSGSLTDDWPSELREVLGVVQDGLRTLATDANGPRSRCSPLDWLEWVARMFGLLGGMLAFCVGYRCSRDIGADDGLERAALEIERLASEAKELSRALHSGLARGAA